MFLDFRPIILRPRGEFVGTSLEFTSLPPNASRASVVGVAILSPPRGPDRSALRYVGQRVCCLALYPWLHFLEGPAMRQGVCQRRSVATADIKVGAGSPPN